MRLFLASFRTEQFAWISQGGLCLKKPLMDSIPLLARMIVQIRNEQSANLVNFGFLEIIRLVYPIKNLFLRFDLLEFLLLLSFLFRNEIIKSSRRL